MNLNQVLLKYRTKGTVAHRLICSFHSAKRHFFFFRNVQSSCILDAGYTEGYLLKKKGKK